MFNFFSIALAMAMYPLGAKRAGDSFLPIFPSPSKRNHSHHPLHNPYSDHQLPDLNHHLRILIEIFPYIRPDVFREMLLRFDGDSRLEVVVDQLLENQTRWVNGRWRMHLEPARLHGTNSYSSLSVSDSFRRSTYKRACKAALSQEFARLSTSIITTVLGENNYSYTHSRPVLQQISARSWRYCINHFFLRWSTTRGASFGSHPFVEWTQLSDQRLHVALQTTGDDELDQEFQRTIIEPILGQIRSSQEVTDWAIAVRTNMQEAEDAMALYECECCFTVVAFEQIATCTFSAHVICFHCVSSAVNEALFGQSWSCNIDHDLGLIRCLAATPNETCTGCVSQDATFRALQQARSGNEIWRLLQTRIAEEAMVMAQLPLIRCPNCSYAEIRDIYIPLGTVRINMSKPIKTLFLFLFAVSFLPLFLIYVTWMRLCLPTKIPSVLSLLKTSLTRISQGKLQSTRFQCRYPACSLLSCITCSKPWRDPHVCFDSAAASLRATVESARTAALKRICPKCGLGFIKESGCNKMTCTCGYTMCYVCRRGLPPREGYRHFCQHFRPLVGNCRECDKCDLYYDGGEDDRVLAAGLKAEKEWKEKEGIVTSESGPDLGIFTYTSPSNGSRIVQQILDWWLQRIVKISVAAR